jgi:UDP-glucose 4-epimerase
VADFFHGKKVLITGGLGFIGSSLAHRLVEQDAEVALLDSMAPECGGNQCNIAGIEDRVRVTVADVGDPQIMQDAIRGQNYLFNLAGRTSHMDSMNEPLADLDSNCRGQLSILEACRHYNPEIKIIFASTRQIYGRPDRLPVGEDHAIRPVDVNGINKLAGEHYHTLYHRAYGIATCALRLTNTYGPRMRIADARQTFLGLWIRCLIENQPFEVWGGRQVRDFTYVDDAVDALLLAAESGAATGRVFNLGGERAIALADLARLLIQLNGAGRFLECAFPQDRQRIDIGDYVADDRNIRASLGWTPRIGLEAGLKRTLTFYRQHLADYT